MNLLFWFTMACLGLCFLILAVFIAEAMWTLLSERLPNAKEWIKFRGGPEVPEKPSNVYDLESARVVRCLKSLKPETDWADEWVNRD